MYEKCSKFHPDKIADRISGAVVDLCYTKSKNPKVACEVLIGHKECNIQVETSEQIAFGEVENIVRRIAGDVKLNLLVVPQDKHLADNQKEGIRAADNGIFKGCPVTREQSALAYIAHRLYERFPADGKFILNGKKLIICQSNATNTEIKSLLEPIIANEEIEDVVINPLGEWTGGIDVDSGATNRKLGSDMGDAVTGGGLMGKDISKADVSVNIMCYILAQQYQREVTAFCAIGDKEVTFTIDGNEYTKPYELVTRKAKEYIDNLGGFEKFAELGLIR